MRNLSENVYNLQEVYSSIRKDFKIIKKSMKRKNKLFKM